MVFFRRFGLKMGIDFAHIGLSAILIPNEEDRKSNMQIREQEQ